MCLHTDAVTYRPNTVDCTGKTVVSYCCIPGLYRPHGLTVGKQNIIIDVYITTTIYSMTTNTNIIASHFSATRNRSWIFQQDKVCNCLRGHRPPGSQKAPESQYENWFIVICGGPLTLCLHSAYSWVHLCLIKWTHKTWGYVILQEYCTQHAERGWNMGLIAAQRLIFAFMSMPEIIIVTFCLLPQGSNSSRGVEDDLSSIHTVHEPVKRVMAPIADIHSYLPKLRLEHRVASVALHIICRLSIKKNTAVCLIVLRCNESYSIQVITYWPH